MSTETNTAISYTAIILARGADTCVPDREDALDLRVLADGEPVGEVTLLRDHTGEYSEWASVAHWADNDMANFVTDDYGALHVDLVDEIIAACREAIAAE